MSALDSVSELLTAHGGHPAAAGFSLPADRLEEFRQGLCDWAAAQDAVGEEAPTLTVDVRCEADALRVPDVDILAQGLADLGPHGKGNPAPLIQVDGVHVGDIRPMGEKHIRMRVMDIDAVWWNGRQHTAVLSSGPVSLVGSLGYNHWRGRRTVRFTVEDARPSPPPAAPASEPDL